MQGRSAPGRGGERAALRPSRRAAWRGWLGRLLAGGRLLRSEDTRPLARTPLAGLVRPLGVRLTVADPAQWAAAVMQQQGLRALPIFTRGGAFAGMVERPRVAQALRQGHPDLPLGEICRTDVPVVAPTVTIEEVLRGAGRPPVEVLPVGDGPGRVTGTVSRTELLRAYYRRTVLTLEARQKVELLRDPGPAGAEAVTFRALALPARWQGHGRSLAEVDLPAGVAVVRVSRGEASFVPRGDTVLAAGDQILLSGPDRIALEAAVRRLAAAPARWRSSFAEVEIPADWAPPDRRLSALHLPAGSFVVALRRCDEIMVPRADALLQAGDLLTLRADDPQTLAGARQVLLGGRDGRP